MPIDETRSIRRVLGRVLIVALVVAAVTAIAALLTGSFSELDWRVIGTSLGFAVYSALAASGAAVASNARTLGGVTTAAAGLGFALAVLLLWRVVEDTDAPVRTWGVITVAAFTLSHSAIVTRARRPSDSPAVRVVAASSTVLATIDGCVGALLVIGAIDVEISEFGTRLIAAALVLLVATTLLPPIMRRVTPASPVAARRPSLETLPRAVVEATERIERLPLPPQARDECRRLREMARSLGG